jgi:hypothetical protein
VTSRACVRTNDFEGFVEARRRLLLDEISKAMGKPLVVSDEPVADDEEDDLDEDAA